TSETTRLHIMDTAEALFLEHGIDAVSDRAILREAGQRNLSALKYHFDGRDGLLTALQERRGEQVEARRQEILATLNALGGTISLRGACDVLLSTYFSLCREDESFRRFLAKFGQYSMIHGNSLLIVEPITSSLEQIFQIIVDQLPAMDLSLLLMRLENANAMGILALTRRAQSDKAFHGKDADLFVENLLDQLVAMISAPISPKTQRLI
ncbi:TetR/AcrR family transcriptional regulator, partial [Litorivivens sp.]